MNLNLYNLPPKAAQLFYAAALLVFGIQHIMFGSFIMGRPMPWPKNVSGELVVAYLSGAILIITACAMVVRVKAVELLIGVAFMILLWAGLRNFIHVVTQLHIGGNLTNMGKAFTLALELY